MESWKFGSLNVSVRKAYHTNGFQNKKYRTVSSEQLIDMIDYVFEKYYKKSNWSLSDITHGEYSWKNARIGLADGENGNNIISLDDIRIDAERIKSRRKFLEKKQATNDKNKVIPSQKGCE